MRREVSVGEKTPWLLKNSFSHGDVGLESGAVLPELETIFEPIEARNRSANPSAALRHHWPRRPGHGELLPNSFIQVNFLFHLQFHGTLQRAGRRCDRDVAGGCAGGDGGGQIGVGDHGELRRGSVERNCSCPRETDSEDANGPANCSQRELQDDVGLQASTEAVENTVPDWLALIVAALHGRAVEDTVRIERHRRAEIASGHRLVGTGAIRVRETVVQVGVNALGRDLVQALGPHPQG